MNCAPVIPFCRLWLCLAVWPGAAVCTAEDDVPAPRVLTAQEWAGVQAAHDDPWPAVREAAEKLMQQGAGGDYDGWRLRIGGYVTKPGGDTHVNVPFTICDPASLPPWTKPPPDPGEASLPPADTIEGKWARVKKEVHWSGPIMGELNPSVHAPIAAALLENEDLELVKEALSALSWMDANRYAPQIAPLAYHRDEELAANAISVLGQFKATEQANMLAVLAETRPAMRYAVMAALASFDDRRAVPIALSLLSGSDNFYAFEVVKKLGGPADGPDFAAMLSSEDETTQLRALETLVAIKAENEAAAIVPLLEPQYSKKVRGQAIEALGKLKARQFSGHIAAYLEDEYLDWYSVEALGEMKTKEHAPAIRRLLLKTSRAPEKGSLNAFQVVCVQTLYRMGDMTRREAVKELEAIVRETDYFGWYQSASLFIELDAIESLEMLLRLKGTPITRPSNYWKDDTSPPDALRDLGFAARCSEIAWFLQSTDPSVVIGALHALGEFEAPEYAPEITALLSRGEPENVRTAALWTLATLRVKPPVEVLADLLDPAEPLALRCDALFLLDKRDAQPDPARIAALLSPGEPDELRSPALKFFARLRGAEAHAGRLVTLTESDLPEEERWEALETLLAVSPSAGLVRMEALLRATEPEAARLALLKASWAPAFKPAAPLIAGLLTEENELILGAALAALRDTGGDALAEQVQPLLRHANWNLQHAAADVLCRFGPRGRRMVYEKAEDPVLRSMGLKAMMENQEADAATLMNAENVAPDVLVSRAVYWVRTRVEGVSAALAESLLHDHEMVRAPSLAALMVCGGAPAKDVVPSCVEAALRFPAEAGPLLLAAYLFSTPAERAVLPWLGGRAPEHQPPLPSGDGGAQGLLTSLQEVWQRPEAEKFPRLRHDAARRAEDIIHLARAQWSGADLPLLETVAADLQAMPFMKDSAAAVNETIREVQARTPLRRAVRWTAWLLGSQATLWLLVLLVYPWSALAQRMMWSRTLRRGLGWWVEPLVRRTPWLHDRMWRPFREQLVPPGEVLTFDEWTFFDAVRIAPEGGAACAALPVLRLWRGVGVLRGESGLGKTTLLQALVSAASRPAVLLRAVECREGLPAAMQARLPLHARGDGEFLRALLVRGSPDVYLDGVQEAPAEVQSRISSDVASLPGANFLLTTQPGAWQPPAGAMVWDVQPLRAADIAPFLLKQGTAAIEAAGGQSLAERQRAFTARVQSFMDELAALPPDDPRAAAQRRMLCNPMEAVLAAELLAAGQTPDPTRLLEQRMEHLAEDFAAEYRAAFPAHPFAAHLLDWRHSGRPDPDLAQFDSVASFLARHRLLRKTGESGWRFRHDKILDWFLRPALQA